MTPCEDDYEWTSVTKHDQFGSSEGQILWNLGSKVLVKSFRLVCPGVPTNYINLLRVEPRLETQLPNVTCATFLYCPSQCTVVELIIGSYSTFTKRGIWEGRRMGSEVGNLKLNWSLWNLWEWLRLRQNIQSFWATENWGQNDWECQMTYQTNRELICCRVIPWSEVTPACQNLKLQMKNNGIDKAD